MCVSVPRDSKAFKVAMRVAADYLVKKAYSNYEGLLLLLLLSLGFNEVNFTQFST